MKYMLIAGEASGDLHAAQVIAELKAIDRNASFIFFGGDEMALAAGRAPVVDIREMAYMGFSEVLRNLGKIRANIRSAKRLLRLWSPDALILIDYPSFNLRVAAEAKNLGIPVFYYISPKVWAWKEWRVATMKKVVTKMYSIFPFEVAYFRDRHMWDVEYVGNPSVREVDAALASAPSRAEFLEANRLRDRQLIALLPGSRLGEIKNNLDVMTDAVRRFPQYRGVVAAAPGVDVDFYKTFTTLPVVTCGAMKLLAHSHAALVTSGTATLETALAGVPQVACYRSNGSRIAYNLMKRMLSVDYVTLPNLIVGREIIPELLLHRCTADAVAQSLTPLLRDTPQRQAMMQGYSEMRACLGNGDAAHNVAIDIVATLRKAQ
ncbi:MAG: lipid-A-disaccharide synthase [Bacteroidales bacterium]|nr:lipid-A-disaccharide synthase [Bacteroidales bacterium]